ncbi:hypothetical protein [Nostoc sp. DedQUE09]|uniref:hypothetical protein n=1 Tax=Nostoc sp. DedQUE09 TaxID=3075394 RepID=UPI002AD3E19C|nr:hypothetical protein [Nostoc sp. DedQUE09]MDZ7953342.1 hypothetical protein [Nostoc sp. DedQUE09]MDZ7953370.1 hypothetical protein [Nostoc sp. DedQUE09]
MKLTGCTRTYDKPQPGRISWTRLETPNLIGFIAIAHSSYLVRSLFIVIRVLMKLTPNKKFAFKHFYHEKSMLSPHLWRPAAQLLLVENA